MCWVKWHVGSIAAALLLAQPAIADDGRKPNAEMQRIFARDQAVRETPPIVETQAQWEALVADDAGRRGEVRALIASGELKTADDFYAAAVVFQHGLDPNDQLLAHTLALVAVAEGHPKALWIAAASLDRYLQAIGQKQIYGTQFGKSGEAAAWTQEPFDPTLISDVLRRRLGVPARAEQTTNLDEMNR